MFGYVVTSLGAGWSKRTIIQRESFRIATDGTMPVSVKTPPEQESAIFDAEGCMNSTPLLINFMSLMPVHIVLAEKHNMW